MATTLSSAEHAPGEIQELSDVDTFMAIGSVDHGNVPPRMLDAPNTVCGVVVVVEREREYNTVAVILVVLAILGCCCGYATQRCVDWSPEFVQYGGQRAV